MNFIGIGDEEFIRGDVPMTKEEIRILTMVKARISPSDTILDVGAGTGSLSIEAARLAESGHVYAIERNRDGIELIKKNMQKFGVKNITVIENEAPGGMEDLPPLNAVIIGGSGLKLDPIIDEADRLLKPGGRIILNCVTVQTLSSCLEIMRSRKNYEYEAVQVQVTRLNKVGPYDMMQAMNPIFIVTCEKKN